jgi:hypothetical protein
MKLLINKANDGAAELQSLTGSYYANNEFGRVKIDWQLAQEALTLIVGTGVMQRAINHYLSDDFTPFSEIPDYGSGSGAAALETDDQLVYMLQIPIAYQATLQYYQSNLVGHDDAGRKVKIDNENEKMAWEWMIDRDDMAHISKINFTTDRLIRYLEDSMITEWLSSPQRTATRKLFVNTVELFNAAYPIDSSPRFFYLTTAFNTEVQTRTIRKALGDTLYNRLLVYWNSFLVDEGSGSFGGGLVEEGDEDEFLESLLQLVQGVIPLLVMVMAVKRLQIKVLPDSVVQNFQSMNQTKSASQPALSEIIKDWSKHMTEDAQYALDDIKRLLNANDPEAIDYQLIPVNNPTNKYFRT